MSNQRSGVLRAAGAALLAGLALAAEGATAGLAAQQSEGQRVYNRTCVACHQATGQGIAGAFPPLVESEWSTGDPATLVRIILHGMTGPVTVNGVEYSSMMPPWGSLSDAEVAAVATYVRSTWGNEADEVTAAEVARIRAADSARKTPWTAEELGK